MGFSFSSSFLAALGERFDAGEDHRTGRLDPSEPSACATQKGGAIAVISGTESVCRLILPSPDPQAKPKLPLQSTHRSGCGSGGGRRAPDLTPSNSAPQGSPAGWALTQPAKDAQVTCNLNPVAWSPYVPHAIDNPPGRGNTASGPLRMPRGGLPAPPPALCPPPAPLPQDLWPGLSTRAALVWVWQGSDALAARTRTPASPAGLSAPGQHPPVLHSLCTWCSAHVTQLSPKDAVKVRLGPTLQVRRLRPEQVKSPCTAVPAVGYKDRRQIQSPNLQNPTSPQRSLLS